MGVVGVGSWGKNIVRAFKELEEEGLVKLVAVVDTNEKKAELVAKSYNVEYYLTDFLELASIGVMASAIAVPIDELAKISKALASRGIHVFIEKPVALDPKDIEELMLVVNSSKVIAQPGFIVRYDPVTNALKEELNKMGNLRYTIFKRLSRRPPHRMRFPIVYDLMIHDIDLALYFTGASTFTVLSAYSTDLVNGIPQLLEANVKIGSSHHFFIADGLLPIKIREIEGITDISYIKASYTDQEIVIKPFREKPIRLKVKGEEPLKAELRDFILRIKGKKSEIAPTLYDALIACKIAYSIYKEGL